jgi:hypothetical protein
MNLAAARAELAHKTITQIQQETAHTWAYRAAAAYEIAHRENSTAWLLDAEEYRHESIEHGALAGCAEEIRVYLAPFRAMFGL